MGTTNCGKLDYSRFLNEVSQARQWSELRAMHDILMKGPPTMVSLAGGAPNPQLFPFKKMNIELVGGENIELSGDKLTMALQYTTTQGIPPLMKWLQTLQDKVHAPQTENKIFVSLGSQEGISKCMEMLCRPGDYVLVDKPTYSSALMMLRPLGVKFLNIETDEFGTVPESLERIMSRWNHIDPYDATTATDIPRFLYTIPSGVNPTGACLPLERKQKIYQIAQRYNLLILEDDPYYFLQFQKAVPSFLSLDTDGRVIRFESFSKVISAGLRLGVTSGPTELIDRVILHAQVSTMHCTTLSQVILAELFEKWHIEGFLQHTKRVAEFYQKQRDIILKLADKYLKGIAEWNVPKAGMFLWMKIPSVEDTRDLAKKALDKEVLVLPGNGFMSDEQEPCSYIRLSYSLATEQEMDKSLKCLKELIEA